MLAFSKISYPYKFLLIFLVSNIINSQNYYLYVASESDDTVSLLKFDGKHIEEKERIIC